MPLPDVLSAPDGAPTDPYAEADRPDDQRWRITDGRAAEWVMRKLAHAADELADVDAEMAEYQAQLQAWYADRTAGLHRTRDWAQATLGAWALQQREADPDAKTQQLPSGEVRTRWVPPRPVVHDASLVAASLARAGHPNYDAVVHARVEINVPELTKATRMADEWIARLTCGCEVELWQVDAALGLAAGDEWPYRDGEHGDQCLLHELPTTTLLVETMTAGRRGVVVVLVPRPDGTTGATPVEGIDVVPGRVTTSVSVRG